MNSLWFYGSVIGAVRPMIQRRLVFVRKARVFLVFADSEAPLQMASGFSPSLMHAMHPQAQNATMGTKGAAHKVPPSSMAKTLFASQVKSTVAARKGTDIISGSCDLMFMRTPIGRTGVSKVACARQAIHPRYHPSPIKDPVEKVNLCSEGPWMECVPVH